MGRGQITDEIVSKAKEVLGIDNFTQDQLRLMPYLYNRLADNASIDRRKLRPDENDIIHDWQDLGFIKDPFGEFAVTKKFWDGMSELLWLGYAKLD